MDTEAALKDSIKKALEILIEHKYITKSEIVSMDGCIYVILGEIQHFEKEKRKNEKLSEMFSIMNEYMPESFQKMVREGLGKSA